MRGNRLYQVLNARAGMASGKQARREPPRAASTTCSRQSERVLLALLPRRVAASSSSAEGSTSSAETETTFAGVTARRVAVRFRLDDRPLAEDRSDRSRPRSRRRLPQRALRRAAGRARSRLALLGERVVDVEIFGFDAAPLRMIVLDSSRSRADSTSVTNAGSPHRPRACSHRGPRDTPKSISPDFWASFPSLSYTQCRGRARACKLVLGGAVSLDRERERRPGDRRVDAEVRLAAHASRCRHSRSATRGLLEAHPAVADLGLVLDRGQRDRGDAELSRAELEASDSDVSAAQVTVARDLAVVTDLDERPQLVRLADASASQRVEILDHVRRRVVVVDDADRGGIFGSPSTASDGIHETAVTDDSTRTGLLSVDWG